MNANKVIGYALSAVISAGVLVTVNKLVPDSAKPEWFVRLLQKSAQLEESDAEKKRKEQRGDLYSNKEVFPRVGRSEMNLPVVVRSDEWKKDFDYKDPGYCTESPCVSEK